MSGQTWMQSHAETITQNVVGLVLAHIVLRLFGVESATSFGIQFTLFFVSYARSYAIRRFFNRRSPA